MVAAFGVHSRSAWFLENLLVVPFSFLVFWAFRREVISLKSYLMVFVFMCVHVVGSHYTYSLVPYDQALRSAFGFDLKSLLGWERNHYDRLVHFLFGLLIFLPVKEMLVRRTSLKRHWPAFVSLLLITAASTFYELMEWVVAEIFSDAGPHFLGTQGDGFDAQKDEALAIGAAGLMWLVTWTIDLYLRPVTKNGTSD